MFRLRRCSVVFLGLVVLTAALLRANSPTDKPAAEKKWLLDRALTISPRAEPRPALKYRLLPTTFERKPGNAVPIYLRLVHEQRDETRRRWVQVPAEWNKQPLDRLSLPEAHK